MRNTFANWLSLLSTSTYLVPGDSFEPSDLNITEALSSNGVNVSDIPELSGLIERSQKDRCSIACDSLQAIFGDEKVDSQGQQSYDAGINYFWSAQQREPQPNCVFKPDQALEVSTLVLLSRQTQCPFAVRSGGHAAFAGASSVDGGITVLFERMKQITLPEDKAIASIEPGSLWYDIYTTLAQENLAVVGGRVSGIGIGGLTTGGGISFFSNQYGWACDNVASFEVVTASGYIVTASPTEHSDLYFALRGGGNNVGIVTKFNLETFVHGPRMFGGSMQLLSPSFPAAIDAFINLGVKAADDPKAAQFLSIALDAASNTQIAIAFLTYADAVANPPIFEEYRAIPALAEDLRLATLTDLTQQLNVSNPKGFRQTYWTATSKLHRQMVEFVFNVTFDEFAKIRDVAGIIPANTLQIITVPQLEQMQKKGGNALGILPCDGPIFQINLSCQWNDIKDDDRVLRVLANIVRRMKEEAKRRDMVNDFVYMNYASQFQEVIGTYGENAEKLKDIARKYDPTEVFQKLQPGYFKLNGPPNAKWP